MDEPLREQLLGEFPTRVTVRKAGLAGRVGYGWDAWILDDDLWFWIGKRLTRRGALRLCRDLKRDILSRNLPR